jgi:hypothetical protein
MRVFLCPYDGFSLAIPMDTVLSVTLNRKKNEKPVEYDHENFNTYISLPLLFNCALSDVRHGMILKDGIDEQLENKIILLTYEIESETELSANKIYPVPKALTVMKFSRFFSGIVFSHRYQREEKVCDNHAEDLILLLNHECIVQNIKKEFEV